MAPDTCDSRRTHHEFSFALHGWSCKVDVAVRWEVKRDKLLVDLRIGGEPGENGFSLLLNYQIDSVGKMLGQLEGCRGSFAKRGGTHLRRASHLLWCRMSLCFS
jgi:hypothetical protein